MNFILSAAHAADAKTEAGGSVEGGNVSSTVSADGAQIPYELSAEKMMLDNFLILGILFFIFYFVLIKPQQRRVKQHHELMKSLKKGDKVITSGGIIGSIVKFEGEDIVVVEVSQGVRIRMAKSSIAEIADEKLAGGSNANDN